MIEEIWKPYPKNPDYLVSSHGRVMGWTNWHKKNRRMLKGRDNGRGYMYIHMGRKDCRGTYIHRMVAETFLSNPEKLPEVNHIDENSQNNHVDNLEWVTHWDNMHHGTLPERQRIHCAKMRAIKLGGQQRREENTSRAMNNFRKDR